MASKGEVLAEYAQAITELRVEGERRGLSNNELNQLVAASLAAVKPQDSRGRTVIRVIWLLIRGLFLAALIYAVVACHSPTQKTLSRHIQGFIYPFMRNLRKLTLPVLRAYPDLTEWHEEPCLVRNPFYGIRGPDCWPCDSVRSVLVLTSVPSNFIETYYHNGQPFIIQNEGKQVGWTELQLLQQQNADVLRRSFPRVITEGFPVSSMSLSELLAMPERNITEHYPKSHLTWKVTRSDAARVLRQLFPRPQFVPGHTEVAIQRFVFIDSPLAPSYSLPLTDFANVWVSQGSGTRLMVLGPSPHCSQRCHPVSVLLQPGDLLFYNWQFWRPRSLPLQGAKELSITFIGSFY